MEKLKKNKCAIIFTCCHNPPNEPCVYFRKRAKSEYCGYLSENHECLSSLANVNKMTLEIKRQKG